LNKNGTNTHPETIFIKTNFQLNDEPKDMRGALWDLPEGEIKDFTREWYIREESPMLLINESIIKQTYSSQISPHPSLAKRGDSFLL
jgi:hypothetical protein